MGHTIHLSTSVDPLQREMGICYCQTRGYTVAGASLQIVALEWLFTGLCLTDNADKLSLRGDDWRAANPAFRKDCR